MNANILDCHELEQFHFAVFSGEILAGRDRFGGDSLVPGDRVRRAVLGYVCMVLDFRAYLRSLRRALVLVTGYRAELPGWMRKHTPRCILALGLVLPCTAEDVLAAYRRKVKKLHPDRGGDRREFLRLQVHFEEAMAFVENR